MSDYALSQDLMAAAMADRGNKEMQQIWIPGVEIFPRKIHHQRHRGLFGEFVREQEGPLAAIGLWPKQWAAARMFAGSAKGFHIHPPSVPDGTSPAEWHRRIFLPAMITAPAPHRGPRRS